MNAIELRCQLGLHHWGTPILTLPTNGACRQKIQVCQHCATERILNTAVHEWGEWQDVDSRTQRSLCLHCTTVKIARRLWQKS